MTPAPPENLLLLCLDLQPVFIRAMADGATVQRRCAFAIQAAVGLGLPVLFTEQVPQKLGGTAPELLALAPQATVRAKETFSALADDSIHSSMRGMEHLLLCGLETPVCVYQTALEALSAGLEVTLLSDCIGARRPDDARVCLEALARAGVHLLPSETVFYALLRGVQHPFFKAYTQLVKSHG
ncbi:MAG: isochorismatase family protein [Verrucomicrobia bacterium]|nr:isochorismatase family protein [Verrucomicrobiota bacterium]